MGLKCLDPQKCIFTKSCLPYWLVTILFVNNSYSDIQKVFYNVFWTKRWLLTHEKLIQDTLRINEWFEEHVKSRRLSSEGFQLDF